MTGSTLITFADKGGQAVSAQGLDTNFTILQNEVNTATQLATSAVSGQNWKSPVVAASTANVNLASALINGATMDGVTLATGNRVLVWQQTDATQNGIYVVPASGTASRSSDTATAAQIVGTLVFVAGGSTWGGWQFSLQTPAPIAFGTTALTFQNIINQASVNASAVAPLVTAAQGYATAAETAMTSLYAYVYALGRQGAPVTGSGVSGQVYTMADPLTAAGKLQFVFDPLATGTVTAYVWSLSGSTLTRLATANITISTTGSVQTFTEGTDFATLGAVAGNYVGLYGPGIIPFTSLTADGSGWWGASPSSTSATGSLNTSLRLEYTVNVLKQTVTATTFASVAAEASAAQSGVDLLQAEVPQFIGRPYAPVTSGLSATANITYIFKDAMPGAGPLAQATIAFNGSGNIYFARFSGTYPNYTLMETTSPIAVTAGVRVFTSSDYGSLVENANSGDSFGLCADATGVLAITSNAADGSGYAQRSGTPATGTFVNVGAGVRIEAQFSVQPTYQTVDGADFQSIKAQMPSAVSGLYGKNVGIIGDSLSSIFAQVWQNQFLALTGATLLRQDARPGRTWSSALEAYGATTPFASLSSLTGYNNAQSTAVGAIPETGTIGGYNTINPPVNGTTLAQWLTGLDLLIIWLGTNDALNIGSRPIGSITDAYTAGTVYGDMNFVLDAIQTAKPSQRIVGVTPYFVPSSVDTLANIQAVVNAEIAMFQSRGLPLLNALNTFNINALNYASQLRSDHLHLSDTSFSTIAAPAIARECQRWL